MNSVSSYSKERPIFLRFYASFKILSVNVISYQDATLDKLYKMVDGLWFLTAFPTLKLPILLVLLAVLERNMSSVLEKHFWHFLDSLEEAVCAIAQQIVGPLLQDTDQCFGNGLLDFLQWGALNCALK